MIFREFSGPPLQVGVLENLGSITAVSLPQQVPVGAGQSAGFVVLPEPPHLEVANQMLHLQLAFRDKHLVEEPASTCEFCRDRCSVDEVKTGQAVKQALIRAEVAQQA